jgi:hypothetical protein
MGRIQHRRSLSIKGRVYARLKSHCDANGMTLAAFVETALAGALDQAGAPHVAVTASGYPNLSEATEQVRADLASRGEAAFTF